MEIRKDIQKPVIETIINTVALALTSFGVLQITTGNILGYLPIAVSVILEFVKYYGRKKNFW